MQMERPRGETRNGEAEREKLGIEWLRGEKLAIERPRGERLGNGNGEFKRGEARKWERRVQEGTCLKWRC